MDENCWDCVHCRCIPKLGHTENRGGWIYGCAIGRDEEVVRTYRPYEWDIGRCDKFELDDEDEDMIFFFVD